MISRLLRVIVELLRSHPFPHWLVAAYLSVRWRCFVSPDCRIYYPFNVRIGKGSRFLGRVTIIANGTVVIGSHAEIWEGAVLHCQNGIIRIGNESAIGPNVTVYGSGGVSIGEKCSIATKSTFVSSSHRFADTRVPIRQQGNDLGELIVKDDVWICAGVTVGYGVTVGQGAIVGANSFVRHDVPPMAIVAGNPAIIVGRRI